MRSARYSWNPDFNISPISSCVMTSCFWPLKRDRIADAPSPALNAPRCGSPSQPTPMSAALGKALPLAPRTRGSSAPTVSAPTHPYHTPPPSQINYSPVTTTRSLTISSKRFTESTLASSLTGTTDGLDVSPQRQRSTREQLDARHTSLREPSARSWLQLDNASRPLLPLPKPSLSKLRRLITHLLIALPFPPLLSFLYIATGDALLRRRSPPPSWAPPVLSAAAAGAVGGAVLALPLALLFAAVLRVRLLPPPARGADEDFFVDDAPPGRWAAGVGAAGLVLGVGSAAGPLGVACLGIGGPVLTHARVAQAGALGGAVCWAAAGVLFVVGFCGYALWSRCVGAR